MGHNWAILSTLMTNQLQFCNQTYLEVKDKQDILPVLNVLQNWQLKVVNVFNWLSFV